MHISLEDNYGAVVVANYEALSQLLERVSHFVNSNYIVFYLNTSIIYKVFIMKNFKSESKWQNCNKKFLVVLYYSFSTTK